MKRTIVLLAVLVFLTGCAKDRNRKNLNRLDVGMTKIQVLDIMGDPYKREAKDESEWLMYDTEGKLHPYQPERHWLTPLYLEKGKLIGWGSEYWFK